MSLLRFAIYAIGISSLLATALHAAADARLANAAENRDSQVVRRLLENKADVNAPQADGMTALHWAARNNDANLVKQLIAAGADAKSASRYGVTPLALACING